MNKHLNIFTYSARDKYPILRNFGLASRYIPHYQNNEKFLHGVDVVLLSFLIRGRAIHYLGDLKFIEKGPSLSVTHFGQYHSILTGNDGIEILNIFLDPRIYPLPDLGEEMNSVLNTFLPIDPGFQNKLNRIVHIKFKDDNPVVLIAKMLDEELNGSKKAFKLTAEALFRLFLIHSCRAVLDSGIEIKNNSSQNPYSFAEKARLFIEKNLNEKLTLAKIANTVTTSPNYLCREFKRHTGKTIFEYIMEKRLQAAMLKLRFSQEKITNIVIESGFDDISFFYRKFKSYVGISPGEYRKKIKNQ